MLLLVFIFFLYKDEKRDKAVMFPENVTCIHYITFLWFWYSNISFTFLRNVPYIIS